MEDDVQASSLPEVNSRQLRAVLAVAEYRSFIAAAAFLKTSQPALTRTIKQIEGALGASLFSRSTRQVSITEAGKEFAALAERLLNDLKIGVENVRELTEQRRGQITVASIMSLAHVALPRIIAEYNRHFPGIEIHLREGVHGNVEDDVRSGWADFGLGYVADMPEPFTTESLGAEGLLCRTAVTAQARARQGDRVEGFERCHPDVAADGLPHPPDHRWSRSDSRLFFSPYDHHEPICDALQLRPKRRSLDCRACSCSSAGKRSRAQGTSPSRPMRAQFAGPSNQRQKTEAVHRQEIPTAE